MGKLRFSQAGISLLEILVVLIVVSVLVGTVGLSVMNRSANQVRTSIESLRKKVQALKEDAILLGRLYAITFSNNQYTIYVLNKDNQLVTLQGDDALQSARLPEGAEFSEFWLGNEPVLNKPRLIIEPSTPLPSFRIAITDHKHTWWLSNQPQEGLRIDEQAG